MSKDVNNQNRYMACNEIKKKVFQKKPKKPRPDKFTAEF
jgi:hypothetical protein